ncbi:methionyl-tRNA synthetase [Zalerion maritima]|uniref:Probable methionine--tRNA ligase, mitochondrial n=1 Tax=Zalerion maritima TaxID=339359 RepID=A0AAD5WVD1_9PEZI|nr:methionyl-tRNA synthetase [Zalerion maritima]
MFLADTFKRWHVLNGREALLCTGTDEHGTKVQQAASREGIPPEEMCNTNSNQFRILADRADISHDFFVRTTEPDHAEAVQAFWERIRENGYIYSGNHEGWYSVGDEAFYDESEVQRTMEPRTGEVKMTAKVSGAEVEWVKESNHQFRLTAFREQLLDFYRENPGWIQPMWKMNEVVDWVRNHLTDLSISRPRSRVGWGIQVPGDRNSTVYIWVDALVNYLTKAGYPHWDEEGDMQEGGWPADVHVIGKDIVRFHCVYWPALLMAAGLPLPGQILVHGHWKMGGKKMSKSLGNVVNPFIALQRWDADALRHFMISQGCIKHDSDYSNQIITVKYQKDLQNGIGGLLSRVVRTNRWSVREAVKVCAPDRPGLFISSKVLQRAKEMLAGVSAEPGPGDPTARKNKPGDPTKVNPAKVGEAILNQRSFLQRLPDQVHAKMDGLDPVEALRSIQNVIVEGNGFMTLAEPWNLAEIPDQSLLHETIYTLAETLRISGILLQPFMPTKAAQLLDQLGVRYEARKAEHARLGTDDQYGNPLEGAEVGGTSWDKLFPRLALEDLTTEEAIKRAEEAKEMKIAKRKKKERYKVMHGIPL